MKNSENIDKIFSDGLRSYERQPSPQAWEILAARMQKSKRKVLPIWLKFASAASVALILGAGAYWPFFQDNKRDDLVSFTKKIEIIENQKSSILAKTIPQSVKFKNENEFFANSKLNHKAGEKSMLRFAQLPNQRIIKIEEINQIAKTPIFEPNKIEKQNTIILVLENTKPKEEKETIVLNMVETKPEIDVQTNLNETNTKKETRLSKIWHQLKRAKNGENVNWSEIGVKPQKVLARVDATIENVLTNGEITEK